MGVKMKWILLCIVFLLGVNMATGQIKIRAPFGGGAAVVPTLAPGNGFIQNPRKSPYLVGKPTARWDVVPYQMIDKKFQIGVIAFHVTGIKEVKFSLEGGPWTSVKSMTLNPRTGIKEYCAIIDPALLPDGRFEIQAIAYPNVGIPRILAGGYIWNSPSTTYENGILPQNILDGDYSLFLNSNFNGSLQGDQVLVTTWGNDETGTGTHALPYKTITKAMKGLSNKGKYGKVLLGDFGTHEVGSTGLHNMDTQDAFITIEPHPNLGIFNANIGSTLPGANEGKNVWVKGDPTDADLIRLRAKTYWKAIAFDHNEFNAIGPSTAGHGVTELHWMDKCYFKGWGWGKQKQDPDGRPGAMILDVKAFFQGAAFVTGAQVFDSGYAFVGAKFIRNSRAIQISGDVFKRNFCVIGCAADTVDGDQFEFHTDLYQMWNYGATSKEHDPEGVLDNALLYGLKATNMKKVQSIFMTAGHRCDIDPSKDRRNINCAFVNIFMENDCMPIPQRPGGQNSGGPPYSQLIGHWENILFQNVNWPTQRMELRSDWGNPAGTAYDPNDDCKAFIAKDVVFKNCMLHHITFDKLVTHAGTVSPTMGLQPPPGVTFKNCTSGPRDCPAFPFPF